MPVRSVGARDFWQQMDRQKSMDDETDYFNRRNSFRSSFNSVTKTDLQPLNSYLHEPVWGSIYCTIRDRNRGRGRSSSAILSNRGTITNNLYSPRSTSLSATERSFTERTTQPKMAQNGENVNSKQGKTKYTAPKRYETTCYFMPLAVPVWYSTSMTMKINSTKRHYKESVNYQKKLVPYRFVETMTTETNKTEPSDLYVSEVNVDRKLPAEEHFISLEAQQKAALAKPFSTNHHIEVESQS